MRAVGADSDRRRCLTKLAAGLTLLALTGARLAGAAAFETRVPAPVRSRYFKTSDGVRLHVLEARPATVPADSPVLAFVPGWSMPAELWRAQLQGLAVRYRVAALDPRGQGLSEVPAEGYTAERRARDIAEFIAVYPQVVLIGWSLGALEVLEYLHRYGARGVAGVVLVDSSVGEEPKPPEGGFLDGLRQDRQGTLERFVRAIFRSPRPAAELRRLVEGAMRMPLQASIDLLSYPYPREHWRDIARAYAGPLLYVVTPQFHEQARNLERNRPGTRIELFARAGHTLFVDEPRRFNRMLEDFVEALPVN